jgi:hypothetical protein
MAGADTIPSVTQWGFGEGNEGVCVQPTTESAQVLVAGRGIPWWGMVAARSDLRMHGILLSETRFSALVKKHFGSDMPVEHSVNQHRSDILMTQNALRSCSVAAVESMPKPGSVLSEMWVMSNLKLIPVSHGRLTSPPPGWSLSRRNVPHGQVGGVTNCVGHIGICFRCDHEGVKATFESVAKGSARPRRDLRSVLKMAIGGNRCGSPNEVSHSASSVGQSVKTVRPGVAMNCGLLEVKTKAGTIRLPRVKTPFGGDMWVIRPLTAGETLGCWDVPERLGLLMDTNDERRSLMEGVFTPLKIRQAILEEIGPVMKNLLNSAKKEIRLVGSPNSELGPIKRGPTLEITTPEEEWAVIHDQSDPPANDLTEATKKLNVSGSSKEAAGLKSSNPSVAVKDDKAPVKTESWDKYLHLGLSDHAKAGPWARASRTIPPVIARHWRRLQLRKWIGSVRKKHKGLKEVSEADRDGARECLIRLQAELL